VKIEDIELGEVYWCLCRDGRVTIGKVTRIDRVARTALVIRPDETACWWPEDKLAGRLNELPGHDLPQDREKRRNAMAALGIIDDHEIDLESAFEAQRRAGGVA